MQKNGIDVEICQIRISEIESNLEGTDLIVTTSRIKRDYGIPYEWNGFYFRDWRGSDRSKDAGSIKEMIREV